MAISPESKSAIKMEMEKIHQKKKRLRQMFQKMKDQYLRFKAEYDSLEVALQKMEDDLGA